MLVSIFSFELDDIGWRFAVHGGVDCCSDRLGCGTERVVGQMGVSRRCRRGVFAGGDLAEKPFGLGPRLLWRQVTVRTDLVAMRLPECPILDDVDFGAARENDDAKSGDRAIPMNGAVFLRHGQRVDEALADAGFHRRNAMAITVRKRSSHIASPLPSEPQGKKAEEAGEKPRKINHFGVSGFVSCSRSRRKPTSSHVR
jgi:hypothetical protein